MTKSRPAAALKKAGKGGLPPAGAASQAALPLAAVLKSASGGEIPLMMPEKLAKGRWLVELEAVEDVKADLAGDAGVVGRFSLSGMTIAIAIAVAVHRLFSHIGCVC